MHNDVFYIIAKIKCHWRHGKWICCFIGRNVELSFLEESKGESA